MKIRLALIDISYTSSSYYHVLHRYSCHWWQKKNHTEQQEWIRWETKQNWNFNNTELLLYRSILNAQLHPFQSVWGICAICCQQNMLWLKRMKASGPSEPPNQTWVVWTQWLTQALPVTNAHPFSLALLQAGPNIDVDRFRNRRALKYKTLFHKRV